MPTCWMERSSPEPANMVIIAPRHAMASAVRDNGNTSLIISVENIVIAIHNIAWLPEHEIVITTKRSLS